MKREIGFRFASESAGYASFRLPAFSRSIFTDLSSVHWPSSTISTTASHHPRYRLTAPVHLPFRLNSTVHVASTMNAFRLGLSRTTALQARHFSTTRPANAKVAVLGAAGNLSPRPPHYPGITFRCPKTEILVWLWMDVDW